MSNTNSLIVGYALVTLLYAGYWVSLRIRLAALARKIRA